MSTESPDGGIRSRHATIAGEVVHIASHRITPTRWAAEVLYEQDGTLIGKGSGATREEAETCALEGARLVLGLHAARASFRRGIAGLRRGTGTDPVD